MSVIYPIVSLDSRMNSEVHNDTAPDSGGGVSAFETMVTEYRYIPLYRLEIMKLPFLLVRSP